jgi:hypothetical protein
MAITFHHTDDDDTDLRKILKDGERMHVPLRMMDGLQRDIAQYFVSAGDGTDSALASYRPGYRIIDAAQRDLNAYTAYDADVQTAWQKPPSSGFVGQREGDLCTIDGAPGHLKKINGEHRCVPDRERDAVPTMDALYGEYDRSISAA